MMNRLTLRIAVWATFLCGFGATTQADSTLVTGPNFQQMPSSAIIVTPTGKTPVPLADALASASTSPGGSNAQIQFNNNGNFGGMATTGSGNVALATSPTLTGAPLFPGTPTFTNTLQIQDGGGRNAAVNLVFPSYAAFAAFDPTTIGATMVTATTAGYTAPGDGGGSVYNWSATSSATADAATKGAAYGSNGLFVVQPTPIAGNGRWMLYLPDGSIHPEQAGAVCDGVTNAVNPIQNLSNAIAASTSAVYHGAKISMTPNRMCYISAVPVNIMTGITVSGPINAQSQNNSTTSYATFTTGFLVDPATSYIILQGGAKLEHLAIMRSGLPVLPTTIQALYAPPNGISQWEAENGNLTNVAIATAGAGCTAGDVVQVTGGQGDTAWITINTVNGSGNATAITATDAGHYYTFPASPAATHNISSGRTATCTTLPTISFTPGNKMTIGVVANNTSFLDNVLIEGFYDPLFAFVMQGRDIVLDGYNGLDMQNAGGSTFMENITPATPWSNSAPNSGIYTVSSVAAGGTLNQVGDVLSITTGTCSITPQVTVDAVSSGAVTAAHVTQWGDCTVTPTTNPMTMSNAHSGTAATLNLVWVGNDFRPGTAFKVHDLCTGCTFFNLTVHGWRNGLTISNTGFTYFHNLNLESSSFTGLPPPPAGWNIGLKTENCVTTQIYNAIVTGYATGMYLGNTSGAHAALPGGSCGNLTDPYTSANTQIFGGSTGSPWTNYAYGIELGPYSLGLVSGVKINSPQTKQVIVDNNVLGWQLRDMGIVGTGTPASLAWLTIDSTSKNAVQANSVMTPGGTPIPYVLISGLPTICTGQPTGTLWNNSNVLNLCP